MQLNNKTQRFTETINVNDSVKQLSPMIHLNNKIQ